MKKATIWGLVVVGLLVAGRLGLGYLFTAGEANTARERVRRILEGLQPHGDRQQAIPLWKHGGFSAGSQAEFDMAAGEFEAWTIKHRIDPVSSFEIGEVDVLSEERLGSAMVRVSATIDGKPFVMRVQQGARVEMEGPHAP